MFDNSLRAVAKPRLAGHGFAFDGRRRFTRTEHGMEQSVQFQLGVRSLQGKFTVNIYRGTTMARVGQLRDTVWSRFVKVLLGSRDPWWKGIFMPKDKWWKISASTAEMDRTMAACVKLIEEQGMPWLDAPDA